MDTKTDKACVVFVHGFGSGPKCWDALVRQIELGATGEPDPELTSKFEFRRFEYPSKLFNWNPWEEIPSIERCAKLLATEMESSRYADRKVILVGHSQGGIVIYKYLTRTLIEHGRDALPDIRLVLTFATPHQGSNYLHGVRKLVFKILPNKQEEKLRAFDEEINGLMRDVRTRIIEADESDRSIPISIAAFGGVRDKIVPSASARGPVRNRDYGELPGNHFKILRPKNREDPRYERFREALLDPPGHPNVFDIEEYATILTVEPHEPGTAKLSKGDRIGSTETYKGADKEIETDSKAKMERTVLFARKNRCHSEFEIRYRTLGDGWFNVYHMPKENLAGSAMTATFENGASQFQFLFKPKKNSRDRHGLVLSDFYGGFDGENQHAHFHLRGASTYKPKRYRRLLYTLDLSGYDPAKYKITSKPTLYYTPQEPVGSCDHACENPDSSRKRPPNSSADGVSTWELSEIRGGIISIKWSVQSVER